MQEILTYLITFKLYRQCKPNKLIIDISILIVITNNIVASRHLLIESRKRLEKLNKDFPSIVWQFIRHVKQHLNFQLFSFTRLTLTRWKMEQIYDLFRNPSVLLF